MFDFKCTSCACDDTEINARVGIRDVQKEKKCNSFQKNGERIYHRLCEDRKEEIQKKKRVSLFHAEARAHFRRPDVFKEWMDGQKNDVTEPEAKATSQL